MPHGSLCWGAKNIVPQQVGVAEWIAQKSSFHFPTDL